MADGGSPPASWPCDAWDAPVLLIRLSSLGDVVLATSALELLHRRRPDLAIDVLTRPEYAPVWHERPGLRRLQLADEMFTAREDVYKEPSGAYAQVLDLQGGRKGRRAAARWAPGAARVTYARATLRRRLLVLCGRRVRGPAPLVLRFAGAIAGRAALEPALAASVGARVTPEATRAECAREHLARGGRPERGWVALAPGASRRLKAVPEELIEGIAAGLRAGGWGTVRLLPPDGPAGEHDWVRGEGPSRAWRGPLAGAIALVSAADAVVASDSGILHLAAALGRPAVGLFGPTVPELGFSPLGNSRALGVELTCRPCHIHGPAFCWLGHTRCWRDMSPETVVRTVGELTAS